MKSTPEEIIKILISIKDGKFNKFKIADYSNLPDSVSVVLKFNLVKFYIKYFKNSSFYDCYIEVRNPEMESYIHTSSSGEDLKEVSEILYYKFHECLKVGNTF